MLQLLRTITLGLGGLLVVSICGIALFSADLDTSWMVASDWLLAIGFGVFAFLLTYNAEKITNAFWDLFR